MNLAAEMDRIATNVQNGTLAATDSFFKGMAQAVDARLEFLAQPPGVPARQLAQNTLQAMQAVIDYLNSNDSSKEQRLYEAAVQAVRQIQSDIQSNPAGFFGKAAGNALFDAAAGKLTGACQAGSAKLVARVQEIAAARKAAGTVRFLNGTAGEVGALQLGPVGPGGPFNPTCSGTNCVLTAIAFDRSVANGKLFRAPGAPVMPFISNQGLSITEVFRRTYGTLGLSPLNGSMGWFAQRLGLPLPISEEGLKQSLLLAGEGSRGIVFFHSDPSDPEKFYHAVNAFNKNGRIYIYDPQVARPTSLGTPSATRQILYYRTN